jgi:RHS repeat-associated protein
VATNSLIDALNPTGYAQVLTENYYFGTGDREFDHRYFYGLEPLSETRDYSAGPQGQGYTQYIFYVYDGYGSVRALTDQSGTVTDTYDYDAFGVLIHSTGTTYNNYLFAGEQFDPDLGLYFNRARYLNTSTGRFWSMDSFEGDLGSPRSLHKYSYVGADPVDRTDPSGKEEATLAGQAVGVGVYSVLVAIAVVSVVAVACASAALLTREGVGPCTTRPPKILYHYTGAESLDGIIGSAVLFASPVGTYGPGQYFTDIRPFEAESHTKEDLSFALYGYRTRWVDTDVGFVEVDLHDLDVRRKGNVQGVLFPGRGEFLNETSANLPLAFRIRSFGILNFAQ